MDQRFGSLEAIAKTRKMIQDGTLPEDEIVEVKESAGEEKKNEPGADKDEEKMIVTGESKDEATKKVVKNDPKVQIEKVGRLIEYLRQVTSESEVVKRCTSLTASVSSEGT